MAGHLNPDGSKVNPSNWKTVPEAAAAGVSDSRLCSALLITRSAYLRL